MPARQTAHQPTPHRFCNSSSTSLAKLSTPNPSTGSCSMWCEPPRRRQRSPYNRSSVGGGLMPLAKTWKLVLTPGPTTAVQLAGVSDTWKCGSSSFIFTHQPEVKKKKKKKRQIPIRWLSARYTPRPQKTLLFHAGRAITFSLVFDLQVQDGLDFFDHIFPSVIAHCPSYDTYCNAPPQASRPSAYIYFER